jgi:hypothetical protein
MSDPRARSSMTRSVGEEGAGVLYEGGKRIEERNKHSSRTALHDYL